MCWNKLDAFKEPIAGSSGDVIASGESGIGEIIAFRNVSDFYFWIREFVYWDFTKINRFKLTDARNPERFWSVLW